MSIRVVVVDDHEMVRSGLATFIKVHKDLELVGEASKGLQAVQICEQLRPDVVIMDMMLPDVDGSSAIRSIREKIETIQIIALTSSYDEGLVQSALQAGAISYLYKTVSGAQLVQAVFSAYDGRPTLTPDALKSLIHCQQKAPKPSYGLTPREQEVFELLTKGMTNIQIADYLFVSRSTVKAHVSNILAKLGAANRIEASARAFQEALVQN